MYKPVWTRQKRSVEKCSFPPWTYPQENLPGCRIPKEIRLDCSNRQSASEPVSLRKALENSSRAHAAAHAHGYHAIASLASLQLTQNRSRQLRARATQRM